MCPSLPPSPPSGESQGAAAEASRGDEAWQQEQRLHWRRWQQWRLWSVGRFWRQHGQLPKSHRNHPNPNTGRGVVTVVFWCSKLFFYSFVILPRLPHFSHMKVYVMQARKFVVETTLYTKGIVFYVLWCLSCRAIVQGLLLRRSLQCQTIQKHQSGDDPNYNFSPFLSSLSLIFSL